MIFNFARNKISKVSNALAKSRKAIGGKLGKLLGRSIDEGVIEQLEELLYEADLGVEAASGLTEQLHTYYKKNRDITADQLTEYLRQLIIEMLPPVRKSFLREKGPTVILIVGVNGNGKTTSIAKLSKLFHDNGKKVLIGAADTFRAAAVEQLDIWAKRLNIDIVRGKTNADPSSVVYDAVSAGVYRNADVVLIDTAGRLQTKTDLMKELEKMKRSCGKVLEGAPHETLLVLDASIGNNSIDQAKIFSNYVPLTGLILTKLDGTAKGGIAIPIAKELGVPITFIGTGEGADDLEPFDPNTYVSALFEE